MSNVPAEALDIVRQLRNLSEAGRLEWQESRPSREHFAVTVALASGQWRLTWNPRRQRIAASVWDGNGRALFSFTLEKTDSHFSEIKAVYDAAVRHNQERVTSTALNAMREELAAR